MWLWLPCQGFHHAKRAGEALTGLIGSVHLPVSAQREAISSCSLFPAFKPHCIHNEHMLPKTHKDTIQVHPGAHCAAPGHRPHSRDFRRSDTEPSKLGFCVSLLPQASEVLNRSSIFSARWRKRTRRCVMLRRQQATHGEYPIHLPGVCFLRQPDRPHLWGACQSAVAPWFPSQASEDAASPCLQPLPLSIQDLKGSF